MLKPLDSQVPPPPPGGASREPTISQWARVGALREACRWASAVVTSGRELVDEGNDVNNTTIERLAIRWAQFIQFGEIDGEG